MNNMSACFHAESSTLALDVNMFIFVQGLLHSVFTNLCSWKTFLAPDKRHRTNGYYTSFMMMHQTWAKSPNFLPICCPHTSGQLEQPDVLMDTHSTWTRKQHKPPNKKMNHVQIKLWSIQVLLHHFASSDITVLLTSPSLGMSVGSPRSPNGTLR